MQFEQARDFIFDELRKGLSGQLTYHSIAHVQDVYQAAEYLGKQEGLTGYELKLLLTAASYHDAGFLKEARDHEEESCRIAGGVLPGYGYSAEDIARICGMIRATRIPQSPHNHLEEILADADLDYLGRDDFFSIGEQLFTELKTAGVLNSEEAWNRMQVRFLESHRYFTPTAIRERGPKKQENLAAVKAKIN